jgi:hypothetical protein
MHSAPTARAIYVRTLDDKVASTITGHARGTQRGIYANCESACGDTSSTRTRNSPEPVACRHDPRTREATCAFSQERARGRSRKEERTLCRSARGLPDFSSRVWPCRIASGANQHTRHAPPTTRSTRETGFLSGGHVHRNTDLGRSIEGSLLSNVRLSQQTQGSLAESQDRSHSLVRFDSQARDGSSLRSNLQDPRRVRPAHSPRDQREHQLLTQSAADPRSTQKPRTRREPLSPSKWTPRAVLIQHSRSGTAAIARSRGTHETPDLPDRAGWP